MRPRHLDETAASYSLVDIRDGHNVIDWFPGDHPAPMPDIIAHGPKRLGDTARGCGSCHLPNGKGRPENAQPGGLPYTLHHSPARRFPSRFSAKRRLAQAEHVHDGESRDVDERRGDSRRRRLLLRREMEYALGARRRDRPRAKNTHCREPLHRGGERADRTNRWTDHRSPCGRRAGRALSQSSFGMGRLRSGREHREGKTLVTTGGTMMVGRETIPGKTTACAGCHGPDLMGTADVPPIAGRSPSYLARQLYDFSRGHGTAHPRR